MPSRLIRTIPETFVKSNPNGFAWAENNTSRVTVDQSLAFAYTKTGGDDKRVRLVLEGHTDYDNSFFLAPYLVYETTVDAPPLTKAVSFQWSFLRALDNWMTEEYTNGRLAEGKAYTFNKYKFEILSSKELDALASSVVELHHGDGGVRY